MNRALLEKPFEKEEICQREGNFGRLLDYIEGPSVIQRLNDAFDGKWSFTIIKHAVLKETDEVIVLGELQAGDIVKTQFGSSKITRAKHSGDIMSLADDLKAAATDALKKTATMFGVALYLYRRGIGFRQPTGNLPALSGPPPHGGNYQHPQNPDGGGNGGNAYHPDNNHAQTPDNGNGRNQSAGPATRRARVDVKFEPVDGCPNVCKPHFRVIEGETPPGPDNGNANRNGGTNGRDSGNGRGNDRVQMSGAQYRYIRSLGKQKGWNLARLSQKAIEMFGVEFAYLSKRDASTFLDHLMTGN